MTILIVAQIVDTEDPVFSFFHSWVAALAPHFEKITVICLKEGKHSLPSNVRVISLGKERGKVSRSRYTARFLRHVWNIRHEYDAVFVHQNQEYVLIAGWLWKLLRKRVYLWRNHYAGNWRTDIAAAFCNKVFCTSQFSYTAKYAKTILMPVGVDTERFFPDGNIVRRAHSILFLGRVSPSKRPEMLIDALALLAQKGAIFTASFVGYALPKDDAYYEGLKEKVRLLGLSESVSFHPGVPNSKTPSLYRAHEIFVNTSPAGMLDKTIFEAAACGCLVFAASPDFADMAGDEYTFGSTTELALRIMPALSSSKQTAVPGYIDENSLVRLASQLTEEMTK
jgi:glycosyltransferase involved in cell wall biosynthesis